MLRREVFLVFFSPIAIVALGIGILRLAQQKAREIETVPGENLYREVFELVRTHYVEPPSDDRLVYGAARGIAAALDPHCRVYDPGEWKDNRTESEGRYAGIGVVVRRVRGPIVVLDVVAGGPAAAAGLVPGEEVVAIDGVPIEAEATVAELADRLTGTPGSAVRLTVRPSAAGSEARELSLTRALVPNRTAFGMLLDEDEKVAYLAITAFRGNTSGQVALEMQRFREQGARALLLDLRDNHGGSLDEAVAITDRFVRDGRIVSTVGPRENRARDASGGAPDGDWPVVVLVDGRAASASEVLAGALQDHQRALLVGERTYGKGVVQTVLPLQTWAGGIKLTTAHYFTPAGRCIEKAVALPNGVTRRGGLLPDVVVAVGERERALCDAGRERRRYTPAIRALLGADGDAVAAFVDPQLRAALELLHGRGSDRELAAGAR